MRPRSQPVCEFCSLSFRRIAFMWTLRRLDSVSTSLSAMTLFDAPSVSVRRIQQLAARKCSDDVASRAPIRNSGRLGRGQGQEGSRGIALLSTEAAQLSALQPPFPWVALVA